MEKLNLKTIYVELSSTGPFGWDVHTKRRNARTVKEAKIIAADFMKNDKGSNREATVFVYKVIYHKSLRTNGGKDADKNLCKNTV